MKQNVIQYDYLLKDIIKHVASPLQKLPTGDKTQFIKLCNAFLDDVISNLQIMDVYLASLQNYLQNDGLMNSNELYSFQQLGGNDPYYSKYLKYKKKYTQLKNK